jgi:hypothetical protein
MGIGFNDGGPAFPKALDPYPNTAGTTRNAGAPGMSLRDWFAGQALANYVAADNEPPLSFIQVATDCFQIADAMLAAREARR